MVNATTWLISFQNMTYRYIGYINISLKFTVVCNKEPVVLRVTEGDTQS